MNPWVVVTLEFLVIAWVVLTTLWIIDGLRIRRERKAAMTDDDGYVDMPLFEEPDDLEPFPYCPNCGELLEDPNDNLCMACAE